jgi:LytS/YehU family sensor histidine kinase
MDYLSGFAKLIRRILNASSEKLITIDQEISMLEGYLKLEKLRFKEKFEFNIFIPEDLDVHKVSIPPLLIQPFVENAVIHGLKNKEGKGFIYVKFEMKPPFLKIIIEDNGVGIGSERTSDHKSKGMSITQKRLAHLNKSKDELAIRIENKKDIGSNESGTIVTLMINTH